MSLLESVPAKVHEKSPVCSTGRYFNVIEDVSMAIARCAPKAGGVVAGALNPHKNARSGHAAGNIPETGRGEWGIEGDVTCLVAEGDCRSSVADLYPVSGVLGTDHLRIAKGNT